MALKDAKKKRHDESPGDDEDAAPSGNAREETTPAITKVIHTSTDKIEARPNENKDNDK